MKPWTKPWLEELQREAETRRRRERRLFAAGLVLWLCLVGFGLFWTYQHVISPSFGLPQLVVKP